MLLLFGVKRSITVR